MRDNFERFGNYLSIDVIRPYVCNATELCYIVSVILNEIWKINIVCEGFVSTETHNVYTFILEYLFYILTSRKNINVYGIFADEFMTQNSWFYWNA